MKITRIGPQQKTGARRLSQFVLVCIVLTAVPSIPSTLAAETKAAKSIALGESNDDAQRAELLAYFGAVDADLVTTVTVDETLIAWNGVFDLTGVDTAFSSTALTCRPPGSGIDVTTRNIEVVPPTLYALALITAGIGDVELAVAAPDGDPALGLTALTGVFQTWDASPCAAIVDPVGRRRFAMEELALVARIGEAHGGAVAVGSTTDLLLTVQVEVIAGRATGRDDLAALVADRVAKLGLELTADEQNGVVDYFARLAAEDVDWGGYRRGWNVERAADGSRVALKGVRAKTEQPTVVANATGVGGPSGGVDTAPTATVRKSESTMAPSVAVAHGTAAALAGSAKVGMTLSGTVIDRGSDQLSVALDESPSGRERFTLAADVDIRREGLSAKIAELRPGDHVRLAVQSNDDRRVIAVDALPGAMAASQSRDRGFLVWWLAALIVGLSILISMDRRRQRSGMLFARVAPEVAAAAVARRRAAERAAANPATAAVSPGAESRRRAIGGWLPRLRPSRAERAASTNRAAGSGVQVRRHSVAD